MTAYVLLEAVPGGGYISLWKAIPPILILLVWAKCLAWADKDAIDARLPREGLNGANLAGMALAFGLFFFLPIPFILAILIPIVLMGAEVGVYLHLRNKQVGLKDLKQQFEDWKAGLSRKKDSGDPIWAVQLLPKSGAAMLAPAKETPERAPFEALQMALTDPLRKGAEQIDIAPSQTGMAVKFRVDGVEYTGAAIEGTIGGGAITMVKAVAGLDLAEVRKPQTATMKVTVDGQKKEIKVQTAGSTAGEYMRLVVEPGKKHTIPLSELGFTPEQLKVVQDSIKAKVGVVLLASPKQNGLTTLEYAIYKAHDSYLEHLQTIERDQQMDLEGITQNKLAATATPAEERKLVDWVISQQVDGILIDKVESPESAADLIEFAKEKQVYVAVRGGSAAEAIDAWRKMASDDKAALDQLKMVIVERVIRKLCVACKESYAPDPATLKKLNLNPEKVTTLYKAREFPMKDEKGNPIPCTFCQELRFKGRTGVFEVLELNDEIRAALRQDFASAGKPANAYKAAFRKAKARYMQEEALAMVERGDTSVQEVLRVLRGGEEAPRQAPAAPVAAGAAPATARRAPDAR